MKDESEFDWRQRVSAENEIDWRQRVSPDEKIKMSLTGDRE